MFTKFGGGRLYGYRDRGGISYGGEKILRFFIIFDIILLYISVTVQDSPIIAADDY